MKLKLGIISLSILILALIPLMRNNFYAQSTIKKWNELSWDDFNGIPVPFSKYGAGIHSNIYLEYDSLNGLYQVYAGQNNQKSWVSKDMLDSDYGLRHEQYHFNISEIHARILNKRINSTGDKSPIELLDSCREMLNDMQDQYDDDTNHGVRRDMQAMWEYKIDSTLNSEVDSMFITEHYSGARGFFPIKPALDESTTNNGAIKGYWINRYSMNMYMSSMLLHDISGSNFDILAKIVFPKDSLVVQTYEKKNTYYGEVAILTAIDTTKKIKQINHYYIREPYLYQLHVDYTLKNIDTLGYELISESFFNSFGIVDTEDYFLKGAKEINMANIKNLFSTENNRVSTSNECMEYMLSKPYGLFRGPFLDEKGDIVFVHDVIEHADSLLYKNVLIINNKIFESSPGEGDQIFVMPKEEFPTGPHWASFGYFLKEDTSEVCFKYYNQMIFIDPSPSEVISASLN